MPRTMKQGLAANIKNERAARRARQEEPEDSDYNPDDFDIPVPEIGDPATSVDLPLRPAPTFAASKQAVAEERREERREEMQTQASAGKAAEKPATDPEEPEGNWVELSDAEREFVIKQQPDMVLYKMVYNQEPDTRALLLRFPNRSPDQPYCDRLGCKPTELRIKPKHGHVELDIPINIHDNWNHEKAIKYQEAMRKSSVLQQGGSYGLAGGLEPPAKPAASDKPEASKLAGPSKETLLANIDDANNKGHVMNKITLAGRIFPADPTQPRNMFGTFKNGICYMSKVDAIVELTANFQHLDALADLEKTSGRSKGNADEEEPQEPEAKPVNVSVKSAEPDEDEMPGGRSEIAELLEDMADEPWQRLQWHDQNSPESWERFYKHFGMDKPVDELPELTTAMTAQQWLDMISAPRYDWTTMSYREMTFPDKGVKDSNVEGPKKGEIGYIDENGWETVDPDAPEDSDYEYEDITDSDEASDEDSDDDSDEDDECDSEYDSEYDSEWETASEESDEEGAVHSGDEA